MEEKNVQKSMYPHFNYKQYLVTDVYLSGPLHGVKEPRIVCVSAL